LTNAQKKSEAFEIEQTPFHKRLPIIWAEVLNILKGVVPSMSSPNEQ
jgi:hypothetical protein